MSNFPNCPECNSEHTYEMDALYMCPECAHEWPVQALEENEDENDGDTGTQLTVKDSNGNPLQDGDEIIVIKDLKVKGSAQGIKAGTRVKNIRLVEGDHDIDCRVPGIGPMKLKSQFVKKG